jgi:hypothetical protein
MKREFRIKDLLTKLVFCFSVLASYNLLHANWEPEESFMDFDSSALNTLNNVDFKSLKLHVTNALKGSWCSEEKTNLLMDLVYLTQPEVCVEIGAFTGSSVLPVVATLKLLTHGKIYAIDAWSNEEAVKYLTDNDPNKTWWSTIDMKVVRDIFDQMAITWDISPYCTTIQEPSEKAVSNLPEIDFLHLDGDYSEAGSLRDVELYLQKVKSGGYILLSNLFVIVNNTQPKLKAFCTLFDSCEMICEIEHDNAVLFRKN